MATTVKPGPSSRYVDFDEYVDIQLDKTRHGIKWTDIVTAATVIAAFAVGYLLVFAVLDHWIVPGGFGQGTRFALVAGLLSVSALWLVWKILLPYLKRVSGLYAARTIEQSEPALKGTLLNLVDLERSGREVPEEIRGVLEKRAAKALTGIDVDQAVDRRPLMRAAYVLLALVILACLYSVFSPKKISFARAFLPPADVAPATRTKIVDVRTEPPFVRPGEVEVLARTQLQVTVDLSGEVPDEVTLHYTTADRKFVDEPVLLRPVQEGLKEYRGVLNGENGRGILQSLTFHVVAGDAVSRDYKVLVNQPPSASVEEVRYEYPAYMELENKTTPGGNIDAWEGTRVKLSATVNMPVKSAVLQFFDGEDTSTKAEERRMRVDPSNRTKLSAEWTLNFRSDGTYPHSYRIHCVTDDGQADPEPALYTLTILPDQRPVVELLEPRSDLKVPANAIIPLLVEAHDPDFKLRSVTLRREKNGEPLPLSPEIFKGLQQQFKGTWDWHLKPLDLEAGDVITYWLEARDNKEPNGNRSERRQVLELHIVDRVPEEDADRQLQVDRERIRQRLEESQQDENQQGQPDGQPQNPGDDGGQPQPGQEGGQQPEPGEGESPQKSDGENGNKGENSQPSPDGGEPSEQPNNDAGENGEGESQPLDPTGKDDAEALRRLLQEQQRRQEQQNGDSRNSPDEDPNGAPQPQDSDGQQDQPGDQRPDGSPVPKDADKPETGANPPTGEKQPSGGGNAGEQGTEGGADEGETQGQPTGGEKSDAENKPGGGGKDNPAGPKDANPSEKPLTGTEKPADDSEDARREKATGDEKGPATTEDDPNADPTTAKNKLERKPGEEPMKRTRPGEGDPDANPQQRTGDGPGSTNPDTAKPAPPTKNGDKPEENPNTPPSTPGQTDPSRPPAGQDEQPDTGNEEQKGKGRPDGQTSEKPQGGEAGNGKPNDQGNRGGNKPDAGDSTNQPGGQEQSDGTRPGQPGSETGSGSGKTDGGKKPGEGSEGDGQSGERSDQPGGQPSDAPGSAAGNKPGGGDGNARGGERRGTGSGSPSSIEEAEKANFEYNKKAANLVLKKLQEDVENDEVDPALLDEFGWTKEDLRKYLERMDRTLNRPAGEQPTDPETAPQQIEEFLKGYNLREGGSERDRSDGGVAPRPRRVPAEFREAYEAYTRSLSKKAARRGIPE